MIFHVRSILFNDAKLRRQMYGELMASSAYACDIEKNLAFFHIGTLLDGEVLKIFNPHGRLN